jgi:hypothetical protein
MIATGSKLSPTSSSECEVALWSSSSTDIEIVCFLSLPKKSSLGRPPLGREPLFGYSLSAVRLHTLPCNIFSRTDFAVALVGEVKDGINLSCVEADSLWWHTQLVGTGQSEFCWEPSGVCYHRLVSKRLQRVKFYCFTTVAENALSVEYRNHEWNSAHLLRCTLVPSAWRGENIETEQFGAQLVHLSINLIPKSGKMHWIVYRIQSQRVSRAIVAVGWRSMLGSVKLAFIGGGQHKNGGIITCHP